MNPVKILASRNILIATALIGILIAGFVVLESRSVSSETMPSAARIGPPPVAEGEVAPLETVLAAYQRSRTNALRRYRNSPFSTQVEAATSIHTSGWAAAVTVASRRATLYFENTQWRSITPPLAPGQMRTFTCADWQSGPSGTVLMYGCGLAEGR